jgi:hypothetical protein
MASLAEGVSALTAHVASTEVDATKQYAVFPSFFFPVTQDSLASDGRPEAFDFIHRVNMIPSDAPRFTLSPSFVWSVYKQVLSDRALPEASDPQAGYASKFAEAKARMGHGLTTPQLYVYFETSVLPRDISPPNAWTPVALGPEKIKDLAARLEPVYREWLTRFNLLPELGDALVESVRFEQLSMAVLRPWFDPAVFTWRFWDLPGAPLSDGADPPRGRLPGVITRIVLARNLEVKLAAAPLPPVQRVVFRVAPGSATDAASQPRAPLDGLMALSGADVRAARPLMLTKRLHAGHRGDLKTQIEAQKLELAREIGAPAAANGAGSGSQKFHVPFGFDVQGPRAVSGAALNSAAAARAAKESERAKALAKIEDLKAAIMRLERSAHAGGGPFGFPVGLAITSQKQKLQLDIAAIEAGLPQLDVQIAQAQAEEARCNQALEVLKQLEAIQADDTCYVLALVCDRVPKSPDPDPALFPAG